jgi:peptidoglycan/LPS O-acetylase OafA/YrhL
MKRFDTLQALRGVAAVSVMLMHCATNQQGLSLRIDHPAFYWVTRALAAGGGAGVDIFFVISGFVITSVVLRTPATQRRLAASADFLLRRILRVFPLYWVTLAGMVGLAAAFGAPVSELSQAWHLRVILLLVDKIPYQPPAWTLAFEMWFYAGTAVLIGLLPKRRFLPGSRSGAERRRLFCSRPGWPAMCRIFMGSISRNCSISSWDAALRRCCSFSPAATVRCR